MDFPHAEHISRPATATTALGEEGVAATGLADADEGGLAPSAVPHSLQKFMPVGLTAPQATQSGLSTAGAKTETGRDGCGAETGSIRCPQS